MIIHCDPDDAIYIMRALVGRVVAPGLLCSGVHIAMCELENFRTVAISFILLPPSPVFVDEYGVRVPYSEYYKVDFQEVLNECASVIRPSWRIR